MDQNEKDAIEKLLKEISERSNPMYYFYYDPLTGEIIHMRNYLEVDKFPHIEIPQNDINSSIMISDYQILEKDEKLQLVKKEKIIDVSRAYSKITEIKRLFVNSTDDISHRVYQSDILIEQDTINQKFKISLADSIKDHSEKYLGVNQLLLFYVIKEHDPNIILDILYVSFQDLLQNSFFIIPYDNYDGNFCNILSSYSYDFLHLVIR